MKKGRIARGVAVAVILALFAATASAQRFRRGNRFFESVRSPTPESFDGSFNFCRIMFPPAYDGDGGGWFVDAGRGCRQHDRQERRAPPSSHAAIVAATS